MKNEGGDQGVMVPFACIEAAGYRRGDLLRLASIKGEEPVNKIDRRWRIVVVVPGGSLIVEAWREKT